MLQHVRQGLQVRYQHWLLLALVNLDLILMFHTAWQAPNRLRSLPKWKVHQDCLFLVSPSRISSPK